MEIAESFLATSVESFLLGPITLDFLLVLVERHVSGWRVLLAIVLMLRVLQLKCVVTVKLTVAAAVECCY